MASRLPLPTWCLLVLAALNPCAVAGQAADVEEIVANCSHAIGGPAGVEDLRSLRFVETRSDPGRNLIWEIRRPNLVRKERPGELVLVFDGQRAGFTEGPLLENGTLDTPHVVPAEDWHHFEMDIALYLPAFFDFPAVYGGLTRIQGVSTHILEVTLPMGGRAIYWVDAESFRPVKVALPDWGLERMLGSWQEIAGYRLPTAYWQPSSPKAVTRLVNMEVNADLPEDRFAIAKDIEVR